VSEKHDIYTHYDGYHCHHVKRDSYLSAHFSKIPTRTWIHREPDKQASYNGLPLPH
jgi:hypothetical protein